ncbi:hypothetical protein SSZBM1_215 [Synechococcus phage S-SZBM1]|uniref:Uncharacterized protein n=1 Tax=Synechococcus phage S-SZBM1 TaxID=2926475 RepID=A0AC61TSX9_9CAUD|nr:hypothetical protein PP650_gp061 [Synechococcus phage S-SZBM1]UNH61332.1 hypothetical protein SSZBM1_215 [Synechococcus phage S-SZBM1]
MPAYILETGRSYPNPISGKDYKRTYQRPASGRYRSHEYHSGPGTNYKITFNNHGPGSMVLGQDVVYYIGDEEKQCVGNCYGERQAVYRWFRPGNNADHKYTDEKKFDYPDDFPGEQKKGKKVGKQYKSEPRKQAPVFFIARDSRANGTVALNIYYNHVLNDTMLSTGGAPSGYALVEVLGYIWTSQSAAAAYAAAGETPVPLHEYYRSSSTAKRDHFYTADPASEVNLQTGVPGVPDCKDPRKQEYSYVGVVGWVFQRNLGKGTRGKVIDIGTIGPTGICGIDRSGWYAYAGAPFRYQDYRRGNQNGTPSVNGWGDPDNASAVLEEEALFEWFYGMNAAVKAAVPRYLSFENSYDSQFIYYLFDTSYPWKGPIYGIQYALSDAGCCPNRLDPEMNLNECEPSVTYHSHFYEVREDSWETYRTHLSLTDKKKKGVSEAYKVADTDTLRILFRYVSTSGRFNVGEKINGWDIAEVSYFGDELQVGYIELTGSGGTFTFNSTFTSEDGGVAQVLAGYGIGDKAAFFGVYEFPKKISYYQVELDPEALIPRRTLDQAEIECIIDSKGRVSQVVIVNGGYGYSSPKIAVEHPSVLTEFSANDNARQVLHGIGGWAETPIKSPESIIKNPDGALNNFHFKDIKENQAAVIDNKVQESFQEREDLIPYGSGQTPGKITIKGKGIKNTTVSVRKKQLRRATGENKGKTEFRAARVEVSKLDENGSIVEVVILDRGSGYDFDPDNKPKVYVVDNEHEVYKFRGPNVNLFTDSYSETVNSAMKNLVKAQTSGSDDEINQMDDGVIGSFQTMMNGFTAEYPTGYIRIKDHDKKEKTSLCENLPAGCIDIRIPGIFTDALYTVNEVQGMMAASEAFNDMHNQQYKGFVDATTIADHEAERLSHLYGWNNRSSCIKIPQPNFYTVSRFIDLPCPYLATNDEGEQRAFGYMIYKYCASRSGNASFRVTMTCEGRPTGSQGAALMNWMKSLQAPKLTEPRVLAGQAVKTKTWPCKRGSVKGRCFRDPSGGITFAPIGTDENTYDWHDESYSEFERFQTWLGANVTVSPPVINSWTGTTYLDLLETETTRSLDEGQWTPIVVQPWSGGKPPSTCWDTFVRGGSNPDGPLDVICSYPGDGAKIAGVTYNQVAELNTICAALEYVNSAAIAIDPKDIKSNGIPMGPYTGVMKIMNYNTGATQVFGEAVKNFGNPYLDQCTSPFGEQDIQVKPKKKKKKKKKVAKVTWDPTDPTRKEYDPSFIIPPTPYDSQIDAIAAPKSSLYKF